MPSAVRPQVGRAEPTRAGRAWRADDRTHTIHDKGKHRVKKTFAIAFALLAAGCATAEAPKKPVVVADRKATAEAQPPCKATPKELVVQEIKEGEGRPLVA